MSRKCLECRTKWAFGQDGKCRACAKVVPPPVQTTPTATSFAAAASSYRLQRSHMRSIRLNKGTAGGQVVTLQEYEAACAAFRAEIAALERDLQRVTGAPDIPVQLQGTLNFKTPESVPATQTDPVEE